MHRSIQDHLEEVLAGSRDGGSGEHQEHLRNCPECGGEVEAMREQALLHAIMMQAQSCDRV